MKVLAGNKRVQFDYFIEDSLIAGIVLQGWEVKSILASKASVAESYVKIINGELFLIGCTCTPNGNIRVDAVDTTRTKKLLVTKSQLSKWQNKVKLAGYTLMIKDIHYSDSKKIKATLCLCKGKKQHDKKEAIKQRDILRSEFQ